MEPTRSGNQRLTMTGIRTLLTAMPIRASALAARKPAVPPAYGRMSRPAVMATMPAHTTAPGPKRRASRGAMTPKTAKQSGGTEVSSPATLPLMPSPSRTSSRRAPRLVMAGRRLRADSTMPTTTRRVSPRARGGLLGCAVSGALRSPGSVAAGVRWAVDFVVLVSSLAMTPIIESWDDWLSIPGSPAPAPPVRRCAMPLSHPPPVGAVRAGHRRAAPPDHLGRVAGRLPDPDRAGAGRAARGRPQHRPRGRPGARAQRSAGHPPGLRHLRRGDQ